jgi:hypothetical protein
MWRIVSSSSCRRCAFSNAKHQRTKITSKPNEIFVFQQQQQQVRFQMNSSSNKKNVFHRKFSSPTATTARTSSVRVLIGNPKKVLNQLRQVVKDHPSVLPLIGNTAYVFLVSGFLMTDMLQLRVALVGGYMGLVGFHALHVKPLQIPLRWSALFVIVNAGAAILLAMDQFGAPLSKEEEELYQQHFSQLTRGQFYQLLCMGNRMQIPDGTVLTEEGKCCSQLYFLEQGRAQVFHHQQFAAHVDQGGFVNDIAFQQGPDATSYGTIITEGDCSIIVWDTHTLRNHLQNRSDMDRNTKYLLSEHLMKSLLKQREARRWNQRNVGVQRQVSVQTLPFEAVRGQNDAN